MEKIKEHGGVAKMIEGFDHVGTEHQCSICSSDYTDDEGGVQGYFGIMPVSFCVWCYSSIIDMVKQELDIKDEE
jgi:hypothetical protein